MDLAPDQAPDAVHDVALVDDHDRVLEAPLATDVELALSDTVGVGVSGVLPPLVILSLPPTPPLQALRNDIQTEMQARRIQVKGRFNGLTIIGNALFHAKNC